MHFVRIIVSITAFVILMAANLSAAEFQYSNYKRVNLKDISKVVNSVAKEHAGSNGMDFFTNPYAVLIKLESYPAPVDRWTSMSLDYCWKIIGTFKKRPELREIYTHQLEFMQDGISYVFVFQNTLVPSVRDEIKLGEQIDLYAILVMLDEAKTRAILLVNEFK